MRAWRTGVRAWLPTRTCEFDSHCPHQTDLRLAAQDARLSSEVTRVQIPQVGPFPPSSNGRISHFECEDRGSSPCGGAKNDQLAPWQALSRPSTLLIVASDARHEAKRDVDSLAPCLI